MGTGQGSSVSLLLITIYPGRSAQVNVSFRQSFHLSSSTAAVVEIPSVCQENHEFACGSLWAVPNRRAHQTGHLHGHCQAFPAAIPFSKEKAKEI